MHSGAIVVRSREARWGRKGALAGLALLALLAGCATAPDVQTLATGRSDVSAYVLNGIDLNELRDEARRMCPMGSEVLRQSSQGAPQPPLADGRWRRALQGTALWLAPPVRGAQLVIQCREPGDRMRLAPASNPSAAAVAVAVQLPGSVSAAAAEEPATSVALPVGPVTPVW